MVPHHLAMTKQPMQLTSKKKEKSGAVSCPLYPSMFACSWALYPLTQMFYHIPFHFLVRNMRVINGLEMDGSSWSTQNMYGENIIGVAPIGRHWVMCSFCLEASTMTAMPQVHPVQQQQQTWHQFQSTPPHSLLSRSSPKASTMRSLASPNRHPPKNPNGISKAIHHNPYWQDAGRAIRSRYIPGIHH